MVSRYEHASIRTCSHVHSAPPPSPVTWHFLSWFAFHKLRKSVLEYKAGLGEGGEGVDGDVNTVCALWSSLSVNAPGATCILRFVCPPLIHVQVHPSCARSPLWRCPPLMQTHVLQLVCVWSIGVCCSDAPSVPTSTCAPPASACQSEARTPCSRSTPQRTWAPETCRTCGPRAPCPLTLVCAGAGVRMRGPNGMLFSSPRGFTHRIFAMCTADVLFMFWSLASGGCCAGAGVVVRKWDWGRCVFWDGRVGVGGSLLSRS
jgi:hypothetical protein